jgi:MFS transporter, SP family, general alpha glucoside:H+ symporter
MADKDDVYEHVEADMKQEHDQATGESYEKALGEKGGWQASVADAHLANISEHETTVRKALRAYPYAALWSLVVSMSIIIEATTQT